MTPLQYTEAMENLNRKLRRSRAGAIDGVLLASGMLVLPLALWGVRHRAQTKRRKRLLKEGMHEFNMQYQELLMRWNRRPQSMLTIEPRHGNSANQNMHASFGGGEHEETPDIVQATLVADLGTANREPHHGIHNPRLQQQSLPRMQQQQQPVARSSMLQQPINRQQFSTPTSSTVV